MKKISFHLSHETVDTMVGMFVEEHSTVKSLYDSLEQKLNHEIFSDEDIQDMASLIWKGIHIQISSPTEFYPGRHELKPYTSMHVYSYDKVQDVIGGLDQHFIDDLVTKGIKQQAINDLKEQIRKIERDEE